MKKLLLFPVILLLLTGCASKPPPPVVPPVTLNDVIQMTRAHATDKEIIDRINASHTVFRLTANEIVYLRSENVSEPVVNYMNDTYARYLAEQQQKQQNAPHFSFGVGAGYVGH